MSASSAIAGVKPASGNTLFRVNDLGLMPKALELAKKAGTLTEDGEPYVTQQVASQLLDEAVTAGKWTPRSKS